MGAEQDNSFLEDPWEKPHERVIYSLLGGEPKSNSYPSPPVLLS